MSSKSIPDEAREFLLAQYGLEHVSRADDARETSEDEEPEGMYTEDELIALNAAQLGRSRSKRALIPFIIAAIAVVLLVSLILGVALIRKPGIALKGYSVNANDVSPAWSNSVLHNRSTTSPYDIHNLAGGIYVYLSTNTYLWMLGQVVYEKIIPAPLRVTESSSALYIQSEPNQPFLSTSSAVWVSNSQGYPRAIFPGAPPGSICQPSASTTVSDTIFVFWKYFKEGSIDSYAWGTGILHPHNNSVTKTQSIKDDLLWDPEATIVVGKYIYVYFLHDSLYGDDKDELYVGRMPYNGASFYNTERYMTYWDGRGFNTRASKAVPIIDQFGKQTSIVYNSYLQRYLLLDSGYGNTLQIYESDSPYENWNAKPAPIFSNWEGPITQAYFMPNLFEQNGRIMFLSYVVRGQGDQVPHILRVKLISGRSP